MFRVFVPGREQEKEPRVRGTKKLTDQPPRPENPKVAPPLVYSRIIALVQLLARRAAEHDYNLLIQQKARTQKLDERTEL